MSSWGHFAIALREHVGLNDEDCEALTTLVAPGIGLGWGGVRELLRKLRA
jgi:hypothetical protein